MYLIMTENYGLKIVFFRLNKKRAILIGLIHNENERQQKTRINEL